MSYDYRLFRRSMRGARCAAHVPHPRFYYPVRRASRAGCASAPDGILYCVARKEVVEFYFGSGECLGAVVQLPRLNGQAVAF
jgi:hypothetical protein